MPKASATKNTEEDLARYCCAIGQSMSATRVHTVGKQGGVYHINRPQAEGAWQTKPMLNSATAPPIILLTLIFLGKNIL